MKKNNSPKNDSLRNVREKCKMAIMRLFQQRAAELFTEQEIVESCLSGDHSLNNTQLHKVIAEAKEAGYLLPSTKERYKLNKKNIIQGTLYQNHKGKLVLIPDNTESEAFHIHPAFSERALAGDYVRAVFMPERFFYPKQLQVLQMIKRSDRELMGTLHITPAGMFVTPFLTSCSTDIFIKNDGILEELNDGQTVFVKVLSWAKKDKCPTGVIVRTSDSATTAYETSVQQIAERYSLHTRFSDELLQEAAQMDGTITQEDLATKIDLRGVTTFTIDPIDAKDFDDALSFQNNGDGTYTVGIHIADVSHYVREGGLIDKEAKERTRSVYFCKHVLPMLPERLSNELCSLQPNVDKRGFSVLLTINENDEIVSHHIQKSIIRSMRRFTYEECDSILTSNEEQDFQDALRHLLRFAKVLKKKRIEKGSLDYNNEEIQFTLDKNGKASGLVKKPFTDAHLLVEELMLCANQTVAEFVHAKEQEGMSPAFLYRIEKEVQEETKQATVQKLRSMRLLTSDDDPFMATADASDKPSKLAEDYLKKTIIQALPKAFYSTTCEPHYGLKFDCYTHFTSPIRRYSDIVAHRILNALLNDEEYPLEKNEANRIALECSLQENIVAAAEKEEYIRQTLEYLENHIGNTFRILVTSLQADGIWVEIGALHRSAIIKRNTLRKHKYVFNKKKNRFEKLDYKGQFIYEGSELKMNILSVDYNTKRVYLDFKSKQKTSTSN